MAIGTPVLGTEAVGGSNSVTSIAPPKVSGLSDGDLMFMIVAQGVTPSPTFTVTGWTSQGSVADGNTFQQLFTKGVPSAAAETATSYTVTSGSTGARLRAIVGRISGVDLTTPIASGELVTAGKPTTQTTLGTGSITAEGNERGMVVGNDVFSSSFTIDSGTELYDSLNGSSNTAYAIYDLGIISSAGAVSRTVTFTSNQTSGGVMFWLWNPAVSPPIGSATVTNGWIDDTTTDPAGGTLSLGTVTTTPTSDYIVSGRDIAVRQGSVDVAVTYRATSSVSGLYATVSKTVPSLDPPDPHARVRYHWDAATDTAI